MLRTAQRKDALLRFSQEQGRKALITLELLFNGKGTFGFYFAQRRGDATLVVDLISR